MKIYPYIFSLLTCIGIALPGYAQVDRNETLIRSALHGLEYEIKAGFSIGGISSSQSSSGHLPSMQYRPHASIISRSCASSSAESPCR